MAIFSPLFHYSQRAQQRARHKRHLLSSPPRAEDDNVPPPGVAKTPGVRPAVKDAKLREGVGTEGVWKWGLEEKGEGEICRGERRGGEEEGGGGGEWGLPAKGCVEITCRVTEHAW
jgi:hypothetical protein